MIFESSTEGTLVAPMTPALLLSTASEILTLSADACSLSLFLGVFSRSNALCLSANILRAVLSFLAFLRASASSSARLARMSLLIAPCALS